MSETGWRLDGRIDFLAGRRWPLAGLGLAVLGAALLAWQGAAALREADLLQQQNGKLVLLQRRASSPRAPTVSAEEFKRLQQMDSVASTLATPWGQLLALFEEHARPQVVLLKFTPDATEGRVEVQGRAMGAKALSNYLLALERDPRLRGVMLQHHEVKRSESGAPIDFTIGAAWGDSRPATARTATP